MLIKRNDGGINMKTTKGLSSSWILIVEDDALTQEIYRLLLKRLGIQHVDVVNNAAQAITQITKTKHIKTYDVVISDFDLSTEVNGLELCQMIRKTYGIPCLLITARALDFELRNVCEIHQINALAKPVTAGILKTTIESMVIKN